jgi:hypothetical protein
MHASPTLHLPHLLRVLGPSSLTLYKHVLGRRRILIYTQPPVEAACLFCQVAADMCFEDQTTTAPDSSPEGLAPQLLKGKHKEGINVLGIVTLHDIDMLERESRTGRGWIACTTDALFLEKPQHYDLVIDLTTYASERLATARPGLQLAIKESYARRPTYRLSSVRFTWSDVKLVRAHLINSSKSPPAEPPGCAVDRARAYSPARRRHERRRACACTSRDMDLDGCVGCIRRRMSCLRASLLLSLAQQWQQQQQQ